MIGPASRAAKASGCALMPLDAHRLSHVLWSSHRFYSCCTGTGKTVTLVECALQLLAASPTARLLLCAPQSYSADLLCAALAAAGVSTTSMLRLNDPRRPASHVSRPAGLLFWLAGILA
jgi:hypothetical protein